MRIAIGILLLAVTGVAHAESIAIDPDDETDEDQPIHPMRGWSWALYFSGVGGGVNGVSTMAMGPCAEVAYGFGRTQLVLEGGPYYAAAGTAPDVMSAFLVRGAAGGRWIARSFEMDGEGAIEMMFEGLLGVEKSWWENGERLVRPEFIGGVGLQIRKFENPGFNVRFVLRMFYGPTGDELHVPMSTAARCTGSCEPGGASSNGGVMFAIGGGW